MEIVFTNAEGKCLQWDGMLWSSPDVPGVALLLNLEPLGWGSRHCSILSRAQRRAVEHLGPVEMESLDLTGMPEEDIGEDIFPPDEELEDPRNQGMNEASGNLAERFLRAYCEGEIKAKPNRKTSCTQKVPTCGKLGIRATSTHDGATKTSVEGCALAGPQHYPGASVCSDGSGDGDAVEEDWDGPERQWSALHRWCESQGMMVEAPGPHTAGGREHDVVFEPTKARWVKYTKPGLAGYMVDWEEDGRPYLRNAAPLEYLSRLRRQNELFHDSIELAGLWREGRGGWRIRTTQPHVLGRRATMLEISEGMKALGLVQMGWKGIGYEDSTSWRIGRLGVWDVHPANVIMGENGVVVPVDVIITELPDGFPPYHFHPEAKRLSQRSPIP